MGCSKSNIDKSQKCIDSGIKKGQDGDFEGALKDLNKSIELNPSYDAYFNRGVTYERLENYHKALVDYSEAIKLQPNNSIGYLARANCKLQLGFYDNASEDYRLASNLDPKNGDILFKWGKCETLAGHEGFGCKIMRKAVQLGSTDAEVYVDLYCN